MTIDKQKLKALAEAATQSHGARRVEVDHNGVHVIGDGSWKILSAWHTPDGKGAQNAEFAAAASPATILALLAEIEQLRESHEQVCTNYNRVSFTSEQRGKHIDQLKAENEALRKDAKRYRFLRNQHWPVAELAVVCNPKVSVKLGHDCPSGDRLDQQVDGAMIRGASHD
ncbi:ead/Ea22-like family protein [Pseudomonas plecoglossicida]|uniref:ead/Ea22-like family protein n=1 Tax=Pseudomonas plecoglossicida TaxID=70775 RepID=UPI001C3ECABF|nr:ead/Ea22-like family protein [Pseudomonas plecoglossicida]